MGSSARALHYGAWAFPFSWIIFPMCADRRHPAPNCFGVVLGLLLPVFSPAAPNDGDGRVRVLGERRHWHRVTIELAGPYAEERQAAPNPFTDYRMNVLFTDDWLVVLTPSSE